MARVLIALGLCFLVTSLASGGESEEAAKILSKAFEAMGGKDKLVRAKTHTGTGRQPKSLTTFVTKWTMDDASRVRIEEFPNSKAKTPNGITVRNGDEVWSSGPPGTPAETVKMEDFRWLTVQSLPPIAFGLALNDLLGAPDGMTLSTLPEEAVNGRPSVGVRLVRKGHPTVSLFFDKSSGLPVRLDTIVERIPAPLAILLKEYKEADGVRRPSRYVLQVGGKDAVEYEVTEFKTIKSVDAGLFRRP